MQSRKYNRTYHFPFSPGTTSDDRVLYNWQGILQHELVMTEKLDGENNCIKSDGVYARSHGAPTRNPWAKNVWAIWERVGKDLGNLEIFGENLYAIHSIEYVDISQYFFVFAIRDGAHWLSWDEVTFFANVLDLPTVPVIHRGYFTKENITQHIHTEMKAGSTFGSECEGFVFRPTHAFHTHDFQQNVLKYVRKNHIKTDKHWTRNWIRAKLCFERTSLSEWTT